jgi:uncharacterized protein involved in exopolysaccharide biosynthesis
MLSPPVAGLLSARRQDSFNVWTGDRSEADSSAQLRLFATALRASRWFLVVWTLAWIGIAVAYLGAVQPEFVASVDLKLEPRLIANDGPEDERHYHQFALDSDQADTELRLLRSERLLRTVFDQLHLADGPELHDTRDGFWRILTHALHRLAPKTTAYDTDADTGAFLAFISRVRCLRLGLSYVVEVSYRSDNSHTAAQVANAIAATFVADRLTMLRAQVARAGGQYRRSRADALSAQIDKARTAALNGAPAPEDLLLADVRVLGAALPPLTKSYPKPGPTIMLAIGFAAISGVLLILLAGVPASARSRQGADDPDAPKMRPRLSP